MLWASVVAVGVRGRLWSLSAYIYMLKGVLILYLCVCPSTKALDMCQLGSPQERMTMSPFPFSFLSLSLSFITSFITPLLLIHLDPWALWIYLDVFKKNVCNPTRGSFTNLIMCWWLDEDHLNKWPVGLMKRRHKA